MSAIRIRNSAFPALVENFFSRNTGDFFDPFHGGTVPPVNIFETEEGFHIELAAPGLKKEKFRINQNHNQLSISYENEEHNEGLIGRFTRREFRQTSFKRVFTIPQTIDVERIAASYEDGIMRLHLPKKEEAKVKTERTIEIQ